MIMAEEIIPVDKHYVRDLGNRGAELYLASINISKLHPGRVYEVSERQPGRLEGFLIGEIKDSMIHGTVFEDPAKEELWRRYFAGELPWEEFVSRGCQEGFDPRPEGDYLMHATGHTPDYRGIVGIPTRRYDLSTDVISGDTYQMYLLLKTVPTEKIRTVITNPHEHDPLFWPIEESELARLPKEGDLGAMVTEGKMYLHPDTLRALRKNGDISVRTIGDLVSYGQAFAGSIAIALGWNEATSGPQAYDQLKGLLVPYVPEERLERKPMTVSYGALPRSAR